MRVNKFKIIFSSLFFILFSLGAGCNNKTPINPPVTGKDKTAADLLDQTGPTEDTPSAEGAMNGFALYKNSQEGFSIQYPEKWAKQEGAYETIVTFSSPQGANDTFLENVNILTEDVTAFPGLTPEEYEQGSVEQIKQALTQIKNFKQVESKSMTLSGMPGRSVAYTSTVVANNLNVYTRQFITINNNKVYIITYTSSQNDPNKYMDLVQKMVSSFKITK